MLSKEHKKKNPNFCIIKIVIFIQLFSFIVKQNINLYTFKISGSILIPLKRELFGIVLQE